MRYKLEIIAFSVGMIIMVIELIGARVLAPYVGTSLFVWTNIITVMLTSLSIGYWMGGRWAFHEISYRKLSHILFAAASSFSITAFFYEYMLEFIFEHIHDKRLVALISSVVLFFLPTFFLGSVTPYIVRLKLKTIKRSSIVIGNLYALSTMGSIFGTFITGYFLLSWLGTSRIMIGISIALFFLTITTYAKTYKFFILVLMCFFVSYYVKITVSPYAKYSGKQVFVTDTAYSRVLVVDAYDESADRTIRYLLVDNTMSSAIDINNLSADLIFDYNKIFFSVAKLTLNPRNVLMIGGGAYTFPVYYLNRFPQVNMDVVEIDSELTEIAKKYFNVPSIEKLHIYHEEGRVFINTAPRNRYDLIFIDAQSSYIPPFQLVTKEAVSHYYDMLTENGVVIVNIISSLEGEAGKLTRSHYRTFSLIFPQVYLLPVSPDAPYKRQNVVLVGLKHSDTFDVEQLGSYWYKETDNDVPILTDDYAPVEYLHRYDL